MNTLIIWSPSELVGVSWFTGQKDRLDGNVLALHVYLSAIASGRVFGNDGFTILLSPATRSVDTKSTTACSMQVLQHYNTAQPLRCLPHQSAELYDENVLLRAELYDENCTLL